MQHNKDTTAAQRFPPTCSQSEVESVVGRLGPPPALQKRGNIIQTLLVEGPQNNGFKGFEVDHLGYRLQSELVFSVTRDLKLLTD